MQVQIVDNTSRELISILAPAITQSEEIKVAVAFVSRRGFEMIRPQIEDALRLGATLEFLVGLDMNVTEPGVLYEIQALSNVFDNVSLYCYVSAKGNVIYHPKMYLLRSGNGATVIIGSSNLTQGGLKGNVEANVVLRGSMLEEAFSDAYSTYSYLKFLPGRVLPDEEFLTLYKELCNRAKKQQSSLARQGSIGELSDRFQEKAKSLRRPIASKSDLVGWVKLVYDALPAGEFTNRQVYQQKDIFAQSYPDNRNIEAKIRQQLQTLRNMGLIEHLDQGRWIKR
jgi:HKD family nuclease